ncbi:DNA mismatch endonuclease Vsr [Nitrosococcus wardiae]|uniref:Very short patch repair endonuclease n=2 Tax=Nitrosococcus wardiae TaxID=1814290 RepID=A0A4V1AWG3_9GAMM|nr:DNA mismatch endonuclease Vsr [Nitrosococcus wardiae]
MSRVRQANTAPEMLARKILHRMGFRFRLHRRDLPGSPDIVLPSYRIAIFVHGCFWHRHPGCKKASIPKSRRSFWEEKFAANVERDRKNYIALNELGWHCVIIWECETKDIPALESRLQAELVKYMKWRN